MAHRCKEHRLGAIGAFGAVAGFAQCGLEPVPFRYVSSRALYFRQTPLLVPDFVIFPGYPAPTFCSLDALRIFLRRAFNARLR